MAEKKNTIEPLMLRCTWKPGWHCRDPAKEDEKTKNMSQNEYYRWERDEKISVGFDTIEGLVIKNEGSYDCTERAAPNVRSSDLTVQCPIIEVTAPKGKVISCVETAVNPRYKKLSCKAK
jgi:hypothetical protein